MSVRAIGRFFMIACVILLTACGGPGGAAPSGDRGGASAQAVPNVSSASLTAQASASYSDYSAIAGSARLMRWAYYTDPGSLDATRRWYISNVETGGKKDVYSLMPISASGDAGWGTVGTSAATVDLGGERVLIAPNLDTTLSDCYWDAGWKQTVCDPLIHLDRQRIQGTTATIWWYFFYVPETGAWYIVNAAGYALEHTVVLKFAATNGQYDWQTVVDDGSVVATYSIVNGQRWVKFDRRAAGAPDVALFMVSGHEGLLDGWPSMSYLQYDAGPEIEGDLKQAGLTVSTSYYVDDAFDDLLGYGGYYSLVEDLKFVRDGWAHLGTRVVIVDHSHGGVWAHAAIRAVDDLTISALVDLDATSYGWSVLGHSAQNSAIGGDPRDAYDIGYVVTYSGYPSVPSEQTGVYDIEDVVFANVVSDLDVRSGDSPAGGEWYDEVWNIRVDATAKGLYGYYSASTHSEVHEAGGSTLATVRGWLRAMLGL